MRGEWIEIAHRAAMLATVPRLPSCEGSGLKFDFLTQDKIATLSPLMRGEWIEIGMSADSRRLQARLPSCEGSGLKY